MVVLIHLYKEGKDLKITKSIYLLINKQNLYLQFYDLVSITFTQSKGKESLKATRIKKKKGGSVDLPVITLCQFLKLAKEGIW